MWKTVCDKERWCVKRWYVCMHVCMYVCMKCSALCNRKFCELFLHALWLVIIPTGKEGKTEQVVKDRRCDEDGKVPGHVKDRRKQAETQRRLIAKTPNIGAEETGEGHSSRWIRCDHCFRTWCSATAASARWSRYLAEQNKTAGCHSCQETATLSWRLSVLESQTDNRHVNHRLITVSFGKPKTWTKPSSWTKLKTNMGWQKAAASTASSGNQARLQGQPSAISATPATQSDGGCRQMPLHVAKCHTCHAKSRGVHGVIWEPSAPTGPAQCHKCHACHAKWRWMSPNAAPCRQVPHLPCKKPRRPRRHLGTKRAYRASPVP